MQLSQAGHKVTVIEQTPENLRRLGKDYPVRIVLGNGLDLDILEKSGIRDCDAFFAMTRGDNTNIFAAEIVKRNFEVARIAVKVADPSRADAYRKMGFFTINAAALLAGLLGDWLTGSEYKPINSYNVLSKELNG